MTEAVASQEIRSLERDYRRAVKFLKGSRNSDQQLLSTLPSMARMTAQLTGLCLMTGQVSKAQDYRAETDDLLRRLRAAGVGGAASWAEGVFHQIMHEWEEAERAFQEAEPFAGDHPAYWLDRGRLAFDQGRLSVAREAFLRVYVLEKSAGRIAGRTFQWLARAYRWLGQAEGEAAILHEAMEYPWQSARQLDGRAVGVHVWMAIKIDDSGKDGTLESATHLMAMERLPRLLIDSGKYAEAIDLIEEWYSNTHRLQAEFSAMKVEALFAQGNASRAVEYAEHMASRIKGGHLRYHSSPKIGAVTGDWEAGGGQPPPGSVPIGGGDLILAAALIHSQQPFSGNNRLLQAFKEMVPTSEGFAATVQGRTIPVETSQDFVRAYRAAVRAVETGRVDLATELLWEAAAVALEERSPFPLVYCIHQLNRIAGDHPKLAQLCQDARQRFPESAEIMLEIGRYHQARGDHAQALTALERAASGPQHPQDVEPLIAEVIGAMGDHDEALRRFKSLLDRDWSDVPLAVVGEAIFAPAIRWAETSGQPLRVLGWVDVWLARYGRQGIQEVAIPLFESAGRAALLLREYERAYAFHRHAAAAHTVRFRPSGPTEVSLSDVARNNAMAAFSALLAGQPAEVSVWLDTARTQAAGLDVIELVSALAAARSGDLAGARDALLDVGRSPLWAQVARLVAQDCRAAHQETWAEELERKADVQEGRAPTLEEALDQLGDQQRRLLAARQEVEANLRYREQTRHVLEALVVRSGLLPEHHASYTALTQAIEDGQAFDPEEILSSVLEHLAQQLQGQKIHGDACRRLLGPAWANLNSGLREQLELAQDYVAYATRMELKDYGPALMYLAKPIEDLLRMEVARPLVHRAAAVRTEVPWDYEFTLGSAPQRLFGLLHKSEVSPGYGRVIDELLGTVDPSVRRYIRLDWRNDAQALVEARNAWAHRRDALGKAAFERLLPRVVGVPGSDTVLGAALAVREKLAS